MPLSNFNQELDLARAIADQNPERSAEQLLADFLAMRQEATRISQPPIKRPEPSGRLLAELQRELAEQEERTKLPEVGLSKHILIVKDHGTI